MRILERTAFWETYGSSDDLPSAMLRARIYEARHLGAVRLERHRLDNPAGVAASYEAMVTVLAAASVM
ncbi:hypothetical protein ABZ402_37850 [Streptomyces mirabilis]|uniref:hypothetical protein n=1 Tax=Streptomyces mirabilis TaxID=68239 RepID=UPI0033F66C0D